MFWVFIFNFCTSNPPLILTKRVVVEPSVKTLYFWPLRDFLWSSPPFISMFELWIDEAISTFVLFQILLKFEKFQSEKPKAILFAWNIQIKSLWFIFEPPSTRKYRCEEKNNIQIMYTLILSNGIAQPLVFVFHFLPTVVVYLSDCFSISRPE